LDTLAEQPSQPQETPELLYFHANTETNGTTYGSALSVPYGYFGVVLMNNQIFGAVSAGEYAIDGGAFPQLAQKLRLQPGQLPAKPVQLTIFLVNANESVFNWTAYPLVTKNPARGLNYCELVGRCEVKVVNPITFYNGFKNGWPAALMKLTPAAKAQLAGVSYGRQAEAYVVALIKGAAAVAIDHMNLAPEQLAGQVEGLRQTVGMATSAALQGIGLQCTRFEISNTPVIRRSPCVKCNSTTAPTAYGSFKRTISMLVMRFGVTREGNFCVPCAAKVSAAYNGTMLVCGWWGYIGIVLTPIYIVMNCYNFLSIAFGTKLASVTPDQQLEPGVWPPPPEEWGQEVQERGR